MEILPMELINKIIMTNRSIYPSLTEYKTFIAKLDQDQDGIIPVYELLRLSWTDELLDKFFGLWKYGDVYYNDDEMKCMNEQNYTDELLANQYYNDYNDY